MPELADVVIVGGGILGAALAWEFARRAWRVTLLEEGSLARGATGNGFAWINATAKDEDETYHRLNADSMARYAELAHLVGIEPMGLRQGGALFWTAGRDEAAKTRLRQRAATLQAWDYPASLLNAGEIRALEPNVHVDKGAEGLFAPADGWVDAGRLVRCLLWQARERGADIREQTPAIGFTRDVLGSISTVQTPEGRIGTRHLVLAAGVKTPALIAQAAGDPTAAVSFPVEPVYGLLAETDPLPDSGQVRRVLYPPDSSGLHLRPTPNGGLLLGGDTLDRVLARNAARERRSHRDDAAGKNWESEDRYPERWERIREGLPTLLRRAARVLPTLPLEKLETGCRTRLCARPMPADERPIVGQVAGVKGVYAVITHSGITLGPLLAQLLVEEVVTGRISPLLVPYRPERFTERK